MTADVLQRKMEALLELADEGLETSNPVLWAIAFDRFQRPRRRSAC